MESHVSFAVLNCERFVPRFSGHRFMEKIYEYQNKNNNITASFAFCLFGGVIASYHSLFLSLIFLKINFIFLLCGNDGRG